MSYDRDKAEERLAQEYRAEIKAAEEAFEAGIRGAIMVGAKDRATAIRWLVSDVRPCDLQYGAERVCYVLDIPYKYQPEIEKALA